MRTEWEYAGPLRNFCCNVLSASSLGIYSGNPYHMVAMRKLTHLLTLVLVLALGAIPFASMHSMPVAAQPGAMQDGIHAAMDGTDASKGGCIQCEGKSGVMKDCLPACVSMPGIVPQDVVRLVLLTAIYGPHFESSFIGTDSRPDPHPPKLIILS